MVEVINSKDTRVYGDIGWSGAELTGHCTQAPIIHIHDVERHVFGNGIVVKVWGELKIAAKEVVYARDLKMNTIQVLLLTAESTHHYPFIPMKWIYRKGEYGNYASIDIFGPGSAYQYEAGEAAESVSRPSTLPHDGSIWLNFMALGE